MISYIILFSIISLIDSQLVSFGKCPKANVVRNFNVSGYMGHWYEIERIFDILEGSVKCVTADYSFNNDGTIRVQNKFINRITKNPTDEIGYAELIDNKKEGKMIVKYPLQTIEFESYYFILGTDYENFAAVWSCSEAGIFYKETAKILARVPDPSKETMDKARFIFYQNNVNRYKFITTPQQNCTHTK